MQRDRAARPAHHARRPRWRSPWLLGGGLLLAALALWAVLGRPSGPASLRPFGAGLPPFGLPGPQTASSDFDVAAAARRAEIAAEEARLSALRAARQRLEQDIAALQREAEERQAAGAARRQAAPTAVAPDAAGAAATAGPAPPARPLRVFVHYRANSAAATSAAAEVAQTLRGGGFEVLAVRGAPFVPSTPVVRYFHEEDQAAAARLAGRLGQGWAVQDFRALVPQPPPQTLEVWLPAN